MPKLRKLSLSNKYIPKIPLACTVIELFYVSLHKQNEDMAGNLFARTLLTFLIFLSLSATARGMDVSFSALTEENHPRLLIGEDAFRNLKAAVLSGPESGAGMMHNVIMETARKMVPSPALEYRLDESGRRLLHVSREALARIFYCSYAYRFSGEREFLEEAERNIRTVCSFKDWNSKKHFLDAGEMAAAVAIGYDWLYKDLGEETRALAVKALREYALDAADKEIWGFNFYESKNNWNQVCNAGLVCAALAIYETCPEFAERMIMKSVETNRPVMKIIYSPDGNYPEGPDYWNYGTSFQVLMLQALTSCLGTDFGLSDTEGFSHTGEYILYTYGAAGGMFNYSDNPRSATTACALWYFADRFGAPELLLNEMRFLKDGRYLDHRERLLPLAMAFSYKIDSGNIGTPAPVYSAGGITPIAVIHTDWTMSETDKYLGIKCGAASTSHGHQDAGSFVFDAEGVRWAVDLTRESYSELEVAFAKLHKSIWDMKQDSYRWKIFRYGNRQHNTLTINDADHLVDGRAEFTSIISGRTGKGASLDMTPVVAGEAAQARRTILLKNDDLRITDEITALPEKEAGIRWTLVTEGRPEITRKGILLTADGKQRLLRAKGGRAGIEYHIWSGDPADYDTPVTGERPVTEGSIVGFTTSAAPGSRLTIKTVLKKIE